MAHSILPPPIPVRQSSMTPKISCTPAPLDPEMIRKQFSVLSQEVHKHPLIYLDNAATTQKPASVIHALQNYYQHGNANVHRAAHYLSAKATHAFEEARETVRHFLHAAHTEEIIWTRGTTEAINLVANSWGRSQLKPGDEILVSHLEHHANIVCWQMLAESTGAVLKVIEIDENGDIDFDHFLKLLTPETKLLAVTHTSNAIGTVTPVENMIAAAKNVGATVLIDGAQAVAHQKVDVQKLGCDFYVFSGHKLYGPTGIGVLYGKRDLLNAMPPWQTGGEMIERVSFSGTTFNTLPFKFESGTPHIAGAIGLAKAIEFLQQFDINQIQAHENHLLKQAEDGLKKIKGIRIIGQAKHKAPVVSFISEQLHSQDIGMLLDQQGIAVRTGHHCAMPLMERMNLSGTVRASFALYNTVEDVQQFIQALEQLHNDSVPMVSDQQQSITEIPDIYTLPFTHSDIQKTLQPLKSWQDKYRQIMLLGKKLPGLPDQLKTVDVIIRGCESTVWLHHYYDDETMQLYFAADSDARIIRGLIALVLVALSGKKAEDIEQTDLDSWFRELDLYNHLSPSRGNGLKAIIEEIRSTAHRYL